jgi:DNA primase
MIKDFSELCDTTKGSLREYLEVIGVKPNHQGFFSCLNPSHDDGSPSMHVTPDGQRVFCFGCHAMYDTIDLAAIKHGFNTDGEDFVHALKAAADDLDIAYDLKPPTAEEIRNAIFYSAYATVAFAVASATTEKEAYTK